MDDRRPEAADRSADAGQSPLAGPKPETPIQAETEHESGIGIVGHLQNVAGPFADAIGSFFEAAGQVWSIPESSIGRLLGRLAKEPLANLYEIYPEARQASPHEVGLRFVPIEDIRGTAVAGAAQRGGDFLPLGPFRGENWEGRWHRILAAHERMRALPPVDLIKFNGEYWVLDGHNRVAAVLYNRGIGVDAMVTELVPLDGRMSERPTNLLSYLGDAAELRAAAQGHRPAVGMRQTEQLSTDEAANIPLEGYADGEEDPAPDEAE
jgi:hypothetical protein